MVALKEEAGIGDQINKAIVAPLVAANQQLSPSDFPDFNDQAKLGSGKELVDRLTNLMVIFDMPAATSPAIGAMMPTFLAMPTNIRCVFQPSKVARAKANSQPRGDEPREGPGAADRKGAHHGGCYELKSLLRVGSLLLKVAAQALSAVMAYGQEKGRGDERPGADELDPARSFPSPRSGRATRSPTRRRRRAGRSSRPISWWPIHPCSPSAGPTAWIRRAIPSAALRALVSLLKKQGDCAYLLHIVPTMNRNGRGSCILSHEGAVPWQCRSGDLQNLLQWELIQGIIGRPCSARCSLAILSWRWRRLSRVNLKAKTSSHRPTGLTRYCCRQISQGKRRDGLRLIRVKLSITQGSALPLLAHPMTLQKFLEPP
jgi:type I restriction enzyme M protein